MRRYDTDKRMIRKNLLPPIVSSEIIIKIAGATNVSVDFPLITC